MSKIPKHIAIVMDGNRRWAKREGFPLELGHKSGAKQVDSVVSACVDMGVKILTLYTLSTENWKRGKAEIKAIMHLLRSYLKNYKDKLIEREVRFETIGNLDKFPKDIQELINDLKKDTKDNQILELVLALDYGARDEICRGAKVFAKKCQEGEFQVEDLSEEIFSQLLDTARYPDPDLLIRTGGEMRMSNFLLWQISYSEVYMTETFWPDFDEQALKAAITTYQRRQRRFGL